MENYLNPNSMNPLPHTAVAGQAFGSGTVPSSFLAGAMLPQREADYRNALNLNLESSRLANLKQGAEVQDYLAGAGNRASERQLKGMQLGSDIGLQPGGAAIAGETQKAARNEANLKVAQSLNSMDEYKRNLELEHLSRGLNTLKGIDTTNPNNAALAIQTMKRAGVDTSRWEGMDPAQASAELNYMKTYMDPELIKHYQKMEEIKETGKQHVEYGKTIGGYRYDAAVDSAKIRADASGGKMTAPQQEAEYYRIGGMKPEDRSPSEQFMFENYKDMPQRNPEAKAQAGAKAQATIPAAKLDHMDEHDRKGKEFDNDPAMKNYTKKWNQEKGWYDVYNGKLHIGHY